MASRDHSLALRKAIVTVLRADATIAAACGSRVLDYVPDPPAFPYIRYGVDIVSPFEATGVAGGDIAVTIHVFTHGNSTDQAKSLMKAVLKALDERPLVLSDGYLIDIAFAGSRLIADQDVASAYHGIVEFTATTGEEP